MPAEGCGRPHFPSPSPGDWPPGPKDDHKLKKLSLYYLEIIDKTDANGRLLPEMILVCNFLRNDLQSPGPGPPYDTERLRGESTVSFAMVRTPIHLPDHYRSIISVHWTICSSSSRC